MKKIILIVLLIVSKLAFAQPTILYTGLTNTTPSPTNNRFTLVDRGIFKQFRFRSNQTVATSTTGWAFHVGSTSAPDYSKNWRPFTSNNTLSLNNFIPTTFANGARYNTAGGGFDGLLPAIISNRYYTFNVDSGLGDVSYPMSLLETTYNPTAFVSQTVVPPVSANGAAKVNVTAAAPLNAGEYVYMRYSTNNFATTSASFFIEVPFVGATGNFFMPCFAAGATINYYFFSSNKTFAQISADYSGNSNSESVYDMATLNLLNNGGPNYNYTQPTTAAGNFAGNYYIPSTCYPTMISFLNAINAVSSTVTGAVIVNVASGYSETPPAGGFEIIKTGTAANTITFRKDGTGANPTFTAPTPQVNGGSVMDAIFKIIGADYITIDGFTMLENAANTVPTLATNNMTEFGVALFYATATDGAQNNTIQNCIITLDKTNLNSMGIYSNTQHNSLNGTMSANITNATGSNSNNKFYGNAISNVNLGIVTIGTNNFNDSGVDIGGTTSLTGNIITNQGTTTISSSYPGFPGTSTFGILVAGCTGSTISNNTIISTASPVNAYGIFLRASSTTPTITHTSTIANNVITVSSSSLTNNLIGILSDLGGIGHTLSITGNEIKNCTNTSSAFVGSFAGISSIGAMPNLNISNNKVNNNTIIGTSLPTTASNRCSLIKVTNIPSSSITVNNNVMQTNAFNNTFLGDIVAIDVNGNYTASCQISGNNIDGLTTSGTGSIYGYFNSGSPSGAITIDNNIFKNIIISGGSASSTLQFARSDTASGQVVNVNTNTLENLLVNTTIPSLGIYGIYTNRPNNVTVFSNSIKNLSCLGTIYGIQTVGGSGIHNIYNNTIDNLFSSASGVERYGLDISPSTGTANIYNNKVTNITTGTASLNAFIYGISSGNGNTANIYNNMVADLKAPNTSSSTSIAVRGITVRGSGTVANAFNNSVYIEGTSNGTDFGSAAFSFVSGATIDFRNNIFVNNTIPKGVGFAAAVMRLASGTNGTIPINFLATSNNNCLYARSVTNGVIYVEGQYTGGGPTNIFQANCFDLAAYKTFFAGRETASFSEIPPFVNTAPTTTDLHLNTTISSGCFNGGQTISSVATDIDGVARAIGTAYEIGADEAPGILVPRVAPTITYAALPDLGCASATSLTATITTAAGLPIGLNAPRMYYKKVSDLNFNFATANNNSVSGWKFVPATGTYPNFNFAFDYSLLPGGFVVGDAIQYFVAAQDTNGNVAVTNGNVSPCPSSVIFTSAQVVSAPPAINFFTYKTSYSGTYTIGSGGNFATLTGSNGLFDSINKGYLSGNVTASIISDIAENGITALNEWSEYDTVGCTPIAVASFRLTIQSDGPIRTISGTDLVYNATALKSLINLNGADRVTFNGGTILQRNLVFRSTNISISACIAVIRMGDGNGSTNIIINNCDIQSNGTSSTPSNISAGIFVSSVGTNNNIVIQNNDIHDATAGTIGNLDKGIFADNNASTVLQILDNNIYNIRETAILLGSGTTTPVIGNGQVISGNSIYYKGIGTMKTTFIAIDLRGTTSGGHTISNNFIGGAAKNGGISGSPFINSTVTTFKGINVFYHGTTLISNVVNNQITNINLASTGGCTFTGIDFTGLINCNANVVGHQTDAAMGIIIGATTNTTGTGNYGISGGGSTAVAGINFTNNTIKYIKYNTNGTGVTNSRLTGIYNFFTGVAGVTISINNNIVAEMSSNMKNTNNLNTTGTNSFVVGNIIGILSGTVANNAIDLKDNTIFNLSNTGVNGTNTPNVIGIAGDGSTPYNIIRNKIYGLTNQSPGSSANPACIMGIRLQPSNSIIIANNMITLTNGLNTNASRIIGIYDNAKNLDVYFNSVYIGGSQTTNGTIGVCSAPYICMNSASAAVKNIKNNIFHNTRETVGTISSGLVPYHYALASTFVMSNLTSNYNDLLAVDAARLCMLNDVSYTYANWRLVASPITPDVNSLAITPTYADLANGDLHITNLGGCPSHSLFGTPIAGYTTDIDLDARNTTVPEIGADENGGPSYTWNGSWSPAGTPNINSAVTFNANYDMTTLPSVDACSVTIGNGANMPTVTIVAGKWLNIKNDLKTNSNATLNVLDKASLVMVNDAGIVTNNGTTNVTKTTTPYERYDYTFWSSPVKNIAIGNVFSAWRLDYAFNYQTQNYQDLYSGVGFPQTTGAPDNFDDTNDDWQNVNAATPIVAATGYAIMAPTAVSFATSPTATVVFSGEVNNGINNIALKQSQNTIDNTDDFNLVGNPYPSSIKADDFIKANILPLGTANNISGTLYFWSHKDDIQPFTTNPGPNIYNFNSNDYANYNLTGATGTGASSGSGSATPNGFIGSGQGFFVEAETTNNLIFNNSMRNKLYSNAQFFRQANNTNISNSSTEKDRFWLNLQNTDNMFSQQLIGYLPDSTLDFDYGYDGQGASTTNFVNFYSIMNNDFSKQFKIQSRAAFDENDSVPLGYSSAVSGTTTISIDHFEGIFSNQNIYLQDNLLNITHDLKQAPYYFTTTFGTFNDRFILKYLNSNLAVSTVVNDGNSVKIAVKNQVINLLSENENIKTIQIYDVLGRMLVQKENVNSKLFSFDNLQISQQTLIVKIKLANDEVVTKEIVF